MLQEGEKVVYTGENGYDWDKIHSKKYLKVGQVYEVSHAHVGNWHTDVYLAGFPNVAFNSVHFEKVRETNGKEESK